MGPDDKEEEETCFSLHYYSVTGIASCHIDCLHCRSYYYLIAGVAEHIITVLLVLLELKINLLVCNKTTEYYIQIRCMY